MKFYSQATGCVYLDGIHASMPADVVELPESRYQSTIANPEPGKVRSHDADGLPILIDPPVHIPTDDDHRAAIAARRWAAETAGTVVGGKPQDTGRDSQALITGAAVSAMLDPNYSVRWKTAGGFVDMDAGQIIALATAVRAHVQACFNREADLLAALDAGTFHLDMLEEGWPNESVPEPFAG